MKLSIIITTRNRYDDLFSCLGSVSMSRGLGFGYEVVVVDDASSDQTKTLDANKFNFPKFRLLRNQTQGMMVRSRNRGAKAAEGEYVLFVDDDNILHPDMISRLVSVADANPGYGILGPRMCYHPSGRCYLTYQRFNFFTGRTRGAIVERSADVFVSDGVPNVFMVRKEMLERCNYFDETVVQTFTEPDLAFQGRRFGYQSVVVNDAETYHRNPEVLGVKHLGGNQFYQKAYFLMRNRAVMVARYGNPLQQLTYLLCFSWFWPLAYSVLILRYGQPRLVPLYWWGYIDGLRFFVSRRLPDTDVLIIRLLDAISKT